MLCLYLTIDKQILLSPLSRSPERREDVTYAGNYLVFGHGPHYCVGKEYAINHLITFLAILSTSLDWTRFRWAQFLYCCRLLILLDRSSCMTLPSS